MKNTLLSAIISIALFSCGHSHNEESAEEHAHVHVHSFTAYTGNNEFFMQHEGMHAGKKACITLFVTDLENFKPTAHKEAKATLKVGEKVQSVTATAQKPGIFNFDITPEANGEGTLAFETGGDKAHFHIAVSAEGDNHGHNHGHSHNHSEGGHDHDHGHNHAEEAHGHEHHNHEHHNHGEAHEHSHSHAHGHAHAEHLHTGHGEVTEGKANDIAFSKEQSWKIDFATAEVKESRFNGAVKIAAKASAAPENFTTIVATTSGKVQFAGNVVEGKTVSKGEPLFYLEGSDVTDNDAAVKYAEAESNYKLSKADYERKKLLFNEKVVSERDFQAAEALYRQAEAKFNSMKRSFSGGKVTLRAARDGYIASLAVSNGDYVEPGTPLATVQSNGRMNITAELPMRFAGQLKSVSDVNIELPTGATYSMSKCGGSITAIGSSANSCNMLPITITVDKMQDIVPGSIVTLYIISESGEHAVTIPRSALVEEMGNLFVFVQNSPISFEKRAVEAGSTDGIRVRIEKGLKAGERIVTKGAVSLKLSQGAEALDPHAGHVH